MHYSSRPMLPLAIATVLMIAGCAETLAQAPNTAPSRGPLPAPVGHRQPTLADLPEELQTAVQEGEQEMRKFDRLLRICTGCGLPADNYATHPRRRGHR